MPDKNIYILSGPIHSGKSTRLKNWLKQKDKVFGILSPVLFGKRYFEDIVTREQFLMEAEENEQDVLKIGKYIFSADAFKRATQILSSTENKNGWIVVDEVGRLELNGNGFCAIVKSLIDDENLKANLILVIRDSLLEEALQFFGIENRYLLLDI